jgi:hypothetical protein
MNDERGPVQEKEVMNRLVTNERERQNLPSESLIREAVRGGHISKKEGKDLGTLDQFSEYRPQTPYGTVPQARSMDALKYSTTYSPTTTEAPRAPHKTPYVEEPANAVTAAPKRTRKKKAVEPPKVSEQLRSYIGSYSSINVADLPSNRGRTGGAREGTGREFSNWQNQPDRTIEHPVKPGSLVSHDTHGLGKVIRLVSPGEFIPGTEERSKANRIKKNTGQRYTEPHAEIDFGKAGVHRLPVTENMSADQRQAVDEARPATTPGFGGDIKTRGRLGLKAGKTGIPLKPKLTVLEPGDK